MAVRVAVAVGVDCDVLVVAAVGLGAILFVDVTVGVAVDGTGVDAAGLGVLVAVLVGAGSRVAVEVRRGVEVAVKLFAGVAVAVLATCSPVKGLPAPVVNRGVQLPPPVLLSQIWKRPLDERSLALFVVGVKVQVAVLTVGDLLPTIREPKVTLSVLLLLLQV
jgi:hypothetical protein